MNRGTMSLQDFQQRRRPWDIGRPLHAACGFRPFRRVPAGLFMLVLALALALALLPSLVPVPVLHAASGAAPQPDALSLAAGQLHTLLVHADGQLYASGDNAYGQLGLGSEAPQSGFKAVATGERARAASAGAYHSMVLTVSGQVLAFGRNAFGQLGTGGTFNASSPQAVAGLPDAAAVAAGAYHSLVLGLDGSVWVFGDSTQGQCGPAAGENVQNEAGQLVARRVVRPQRIVESGARAIAAGAAHSLILMENGQVLACGANDRGQLGDGTRTGRSDLLPVPGIPPAMMIAAGSDHSLVVAGEPAPGTAAQGQAAVPAQSAQSLFAFGDNSLGQLGIGSTFALDAQSSVPVRVDWASAAGAGFEIARLAAGYSNSALIAEKRTAAGQPAGEAARGDSRADPRTARILLWGSNAYGQLGTGGDASQDKPLLLKAVDQGHPGDTFLPLEAAAVGGGHIVLASRRGLLGGAGRNSHGQLAISGGPTEPAFTGIALPPLGDSQPSPSLDRVRAATFGQAVADRRDASKALPLQVPWDTAYAFGENSVPRPADPLQPYHIAAGLLIVAALLSAGLVLDSQRRKGLPPLGRRKAASADEAASSDEVASLPETVSADETASPAEAASPPEAASADEQERPAAGGQAALDPAAHERPVSEEAVHTGSGQPENGDPAGK